MTAKRIIGMVLLAAAALFGLADLWYAYVPTYGADDITMGKLWLLISARSLTIVQNVIQRHLWSGLWDFGFTPFLVAPAWAFFGGLGMVFIAFGRPSVVDR